ncbi:hypothetical protein PHMEG_00035637 [Phytophthora megakarya]|uniref:Uncharacterized protein n=1 Tax=Phytophthora megakarya TaxID=4795 RepID=A0A225UMX3_9STRA|nr:hypothetical protein PHMEG_00035637 [Phytophthora megakarya]
MSVRGSTRGGRTGGRCITSRQSRRVQGLQPEEHKDLEAVIQDARKAGAAMRKAAQEEKESSTSREEPSPEQAAQDADIEVGPRQEESSTLTSLLSSEGSMDEGVSIVDAPAQASVGGAIKVEPPTEDRVSDTPHPVIDVESLDETVTIKEEGPLLTVEEEPALEEKAAPPAPTTPSSTPASVIQDEPPRMSVVLDGSSPTSSVDSESQGTQMNEAQAKAYVAGQVQRWEREARERVLPPRAIYLAKQLRAMVDCHDRDVTSP